MEEILSSLGYTFLRNKADVVESKCPYIIQLDGDETSANPEDTSPSNKRSPSAPQVMLLDPGIWIVEKEGISNPGTVLNEKRDEVLEALFSDSELLGLLHNLGIRYEGCATAFRAGRHLTGEMGLNVTLAYVHRII